MFTPFIFPSAVGIKRDAYLVFAPTYRFFLRVGAIGVMPRAEVMTLFIPVYPTATKMDNSGAHVTPSQ
jgi:hypothetical protein